MKNKEVYERFGIAEKVKGVTCEVVEEDITEMVWLCEKNVK